MPVVIRENGQTVTVRQGRSTVTVRSPSYKVRVTSGVLVGGTPYTESYEVTPTSGEQVLPTRSKTMRDDLTVHAVPYHETTNESGGYTVSILS